MINETTLAEFKSRFRGEIIGKSDSKYVEAKKVYNGMIK